MKILLPFLLLAVLACPALAAGVNLAWDAPTSGADGYGIFVKDYENPYNYDAPAWTGSDTTCTVTVPDDRQSAFVARAFIWGAYDLDGNRTRHWSDDSNEVVYNPDDTQPPPGEPTLLRIDININININP